ncbi:hypothetical protein [Aquitalea sp. LB_tupeE]|uniref:hypothetical protein n=1 Tax=Aquitalea sp. LB_tupeE TaxID=2748078 RepID=UPI0015BBE8B7|nr:hypothetical protein [Aquitalea sp. LB_tupeE]NWK78179.1 hypothetical protein [Aquitalea sp. LB_tupeE]
MLRKLTGLASALIATTAHASVPPVTSENRINGTNTYCFSAMGDKKPIFISLTLLQGPRRDAYVQYNNGAKIRLKYSYYRNITLKGEKFKNYRYVYDEIINKKMTGFYSFYLYGDGLSVFNYVHREGPQEYFFFPDYGAAKASPPASLCDWSKSDLLDGDESK